jgi:hypothetical protein
MSRVVMPKEILFIALYRDIPVKESKYILTTSFLYQFR